MRQPARKQPQPFDDPMGVGQEKVCRIRIEVNEAVIAKAAREAYSMGHINPVWRAMRRRQIRDAQNEIERAQAILEGMK